MKNQNLLKTYTDNKSNLLCVLYDTIDELYYCTGYDDEESCSLDEIKKYIGVLASIIQDIDHTNKTIDVVEKLNEEEQENNG